MAENPAKAPVVARLVYRHNRVTRVTHWVSALALMILFMSGLGIFNAHPYLYWGSTSDPDKAFFSIGASQDDGDVRGFVDFYGRKIDTTGFLGVQQGVFGPFARAFPSWLTVPGYYSLAAARRWHFFFGWLFAITGIIYLLYNFPAGHIRKFFFTLYDAKKVPAMAAYYFGIRKNSPQEGEYNPLQKMAYTGVFIILAPLILLSGMAMSPQLNVAFHWLPAAFGGRQSARAVHFILAFGFLFFALGHVLMVLTQGFLNNMRSMTSGWYKEKIPLAIETTPEPSPSQAAAVSSEQEREKINEAQSYLSRRKVLLGAFQGAALIVLSGCEKLFDSLSQNKNVQSLLEVAEQGSRRAQRLVTRRNKLAKEFEPRDISPRFRPNGNPPPITIDYTADAQNHWTKWRLEVSGLVQQPASFSLTDLQALPSRTQITRHDCVEGWSVIGKWKGVRLEEIISRVKPASDAKYVVFRCMDTDSDGVNYFESIDMIDAVHPQTILAYELNDHPLPIENGAPLRLRVETQLGYKHAKYIRALEFVSSLEKIGQGKGGYWEDQGYEWYAGI